MKHLKSYRVFEGFEPYTIGVLMDNIQSILDDYNIPFRSDGEEEGTFSTNLYWKYDKLEDGIIIKNIPDAIWKSLLNDINITKGIIESKVGKKIVVFLINIAHVVPINGELKEYKGSISIGLM